MFLLETVLGPFEVNSHILLTLSVIRDILELMFDVSRRYNTPKGTERVKLV